jgi:hypothetical protein
MNFWGGFTLRECLTIGFTAALIVLAEMLLRIPMHLPGHRVFPLAFFLLFARDAVDRRWAATLVGVLTAAGCAAAGRDGLDHLFKYVAAGAVTDIAALIAPHVLRSSLVGAATGALIGASWLPAGLLIDRLAGMDAGAALQHTLLKLGSAMLFGAAGGVLASSVSGRLRRSGVLPTRGVVQNSLSAGQANGRPFPPAVS